MEKSEKTEEEMVRNVSGNRRDRLEDKRAGNRM